MGVPLEQLRAGRRDALKPPKDCLCNRGDGDHAVTFTLGEANG